MSTVTVAELEGAIGEYIQRAERGETVVVTKDGQPIVEITPVATPRSQEPRPIGLCRGMFVVPDDFDAPLPEEILRDFEGR